MIQNKPVHELRILPEYWEKVRSGNKRAEARKNDRDYQSGDLVRFIVQSARDETNQQGYTSYDLTDEATKEYLYVTLTCFIEEIMVFKKDM